MGQAPFRAARHGKQIGRLISHYHSIKGAGRQPRAYSRKARQKPGCENGDGKDQVTTIWLRSMPIQQV